METPSAVIYPNFRGSGYIYFHLPIRLTRQCGITSGARFLAFVRDGKIVIEQEGKEQRGA